MGISYSPHIVSDGLVLCLDAANPRSYPGSGTTWYDLSGNGNHGTLVNSPVYSTENRGYFVLGNTNGYAVVSDSVDFDFDYMTLEYILRPRDSIHVRPFINRSDESSWSPFRFLMAIDNNKDSSIRFMFQIYVSSTVYFISSDNGVYNTSDIQNVNCVYDGSEISMYVNGNKQSDTESISGVLDKSNLPLRVGINSAYSPDRYAYQYSYGIKLYSRPLSPQEIQQNFNATRGRYGN